MKKMICLALCFLFLAGCSGVRSLTEEDFAFYEKGKCIAKLEEVVKMNEYGIRVFDYSQEGRNLFPDRVLETRRGIKIGSTIREITEAYSGLVIGYVLPVSEDEGRFRSEDLLIDNFFKQLADYDTTEYTVVFGGWILDGEFMESIKADEYIEQSGQTDTSKSDLGYSLSLFFEMEDNIVKDISVMSIDP